MNDNLKTGLLIAFSALTLFNTIMIFTDDEKSYDRGATNYNNSVTPDVSSNEIQPNVDQNQANIPPAYTGPTTSISFSQMEHDFGVIEQNTTNEKIFTFTNTGNEPLIISDAKGSCGCTVPDYPREPIAPGEKGEIKVVYSPGNQANQQQKNVTITANTEPAATVLRIKANVTPGENANVDGSTPIQIGG